MQIVEDYRALHRIPELDRDLPKTTAYLRARLQALPCRVFSPAAGALCAWFDFEAERSLAFRADMDALPMEEQTGLSYASSHPGVTHACGHDGHMAMLLELARRIRPGKKNILLIFQPAEETEGGARSVCQSGVLRAYGVEAVFGLHLWPGLPEGKLFSRPGPMMAASCPVTVRFYGKAAHISRPEQGADALKAAVDLYRQAPGVRFGRLTAGEAPNCVAERACLEGTMRSFSDEEITRWKTSLLTLAGEIQEKTGCTAEVVFGPGYPAVVNPPSLYERARHSLPLEMLEAPVFATEDFSYYQAQVPGLFFFLGVGQTPPLHSPRFCFPEAVLTQGADFLERLKNS